MHNMIYVEADLASKHYEKPLSAEARTVRNLVAGAFLSFMLIGRSVDTQMIFFCAKN
jgi:hypothetical protein